LHRHRGDGDAENRAALRGDAGRPMTPHFTCPACSRATPEPLGVEVNGRRVCPDCAAKEGGAPDLMTLLFDAARSGELFFTLGAVLALLSLPLAYFGPGKHSSIVWLGLCLAAGCVAMTTGAMITIRRRVLDRLDRIDQRLTAIEKRLENDED